MVQEQPHDSSRDGEEACPPNTLSWHRKNALARRPCLYQPRPAGRWRQGASTAGLPVTWKAGALISSFLHFSQTFAHPDSGKLW